ncbi:phage holin family protein [Yinghuangia sp. ASG 101]|uniref:phage holin family protein n=1 Tax=Yinghuangia sp. ASG 101 TaxID=2896848 RepID=UPI001E61ADE7|nr:phage holin family protein [Yinghuangia sp. ASG 101]UGQ08912.1 phage holin family protein [Yinghuangia sp. ASG 101]
MKSLLIKLLANAAAIAITAAVVDGVNITGDSNSDKAVTVILVALIFGAINVFIKPLVKLFALPLFILTLGLITFVINALMLWLTSWVSDEADLGFHVEGFFPALLGALCVSLVSWVLTLILDRD